jgi:4-amino-4-deoxy-L-arabinose transferase-like glycosyltransferase
LKYTSLNQKEVIFLFLVLIAASVLLFLNLGNTSLLQDEAQTALVSQTILTDGVPKGYDEKNLFSQELGAEYGDNYVWKWHTWFPFYLLAIFFRVFGTTTLVARLPFALFGLGCLLLLYFCPNRSGEIKGLRLWRRQVFFFQFLS